MTRNFTEIWTEYVRWLDTLGFSNGLIYDYKGRIKDFNQERTSVEEAD